MHKRVRQALGVFAWVAAAVVIGLALVTAGFRVIAPALPEYREDLSAWASNAFGAPVELDRLDLRWRGLRPELVLAGVRFVSADAHRALSVAEVRVGVSLYSLFARGRLAPARIVLVEPDFTLIVAPGTGNDAGARWAQTFEARGRRGEVHVERGRLTLVLDNGRRRVSFDAIDGRLQSDGLNHRLELDARPGHGVDGHVTAQGTARGWPGEQAWSARATVRMTDVDLGALHRLGGLEASVEASLDLAAELVAERGELQTLEVTAALADIDGASATSAAATLAWTRRAGGWDAAFRGTGPGGRRNGALTLAYDAPAGVADAAAWRLDGEDLFLEDLALFASALPTPADATLRPWLARAPRGEVRDLALVVSRPPAGDARVELSLAASALALDADEASDVPGFHGVSLALDATHARGHGALSIADGGVHFPRVFRAPFALASAEVVGDWVRTDRRWRIALPTIAVRNAHVSAGGTGALALVPGDRPRLTLDLAFTDAELSAHAAYLPVNTMPASVVEWLDRAVLAGRAPHGIFRYDGPAGGGALAAGEASLEARFPATGLTVAFADGWPALEEGAADVSFSARGFEALVSGGRLGATAIRGTRVAIDDFSLPVLDIGGGTDGEIGPMLDTFRTTPVGAAQWLRGARADGNASLTLGIALPLHEDAAADVAGTLTLAGASFALDGFAHPLTGLDGVLAISEDGIDADGVRGLLLGRPATVAVTTARDEAGTARAAVVRIDGAFDRPALERIAGRPLPMIDGDTAWRSTLTAPYDDGEPELEIASDLVGLSLDLPAPLGKRADEARALSVRIALAPDARDVAVDDGDQVRARGTFERGDDGDWLLARGRVHLGSGTLAPPPPTGLAISGVLAHWRHGTGETPAFGAPPRGFPLTAVDLAFGEFELYGRSLGAVHVDGHRQADAWTWALDGPQVAGELELPDAPDNARPIRAVFERLIVPPKRDDADAARPVARDLAATAVPPVAFHAKRLHVGALELGEVNGALTRVEHGIALERFTATRADARIVAEGTWRTVDGYHRTALRGTVDSTDVRATLAALGYAASMEAAAGHMELDVSWMDSVLGEPLETLNGTVGVRLERGNLIEVEAGAGRVFGLLSLYALPRRLALDFSDVFRRGLAFDTIVGAFEIRDGQAFSDDLELRGPAVRVEVRGRTGLATRDYEQEAQVTANLASSLTLAGALAGGPGVGAALLIASELFKGQLEDIARVRYRVTGSWDEPVIERIDETR